MIVLDETTYYITAFAVDSNDTVISSQTASVTTEFWWHPSANTLLYRPLTSNANDYSWNNRNWTAYASVSFTQNWAYFSWSAYNTNFIDFPSSFYPWTSFTISLWIKKLETNKELRMFSDRWNNYRRILRSLTNNWYLYLLYWNWYTSQSDWTNIQTYSANTWYNYVLVKNWTKGTIYRNWVLVWEHTFSYNSSPWWLSWWEYWIWFIRTSSSTTTANWTWYMKDYIIESKLWTAQEVIDYYNKTKNHYV